MISISIPVKKHVKKYLIAKYGSEHIVSRKSFIGLLLLELLQKKMEKPTQKFDCDERYKMIIPEYYFNTKGFSIGYNKAKFLGICLEKLFYEDFHGFIAIELKKEKANAYQAVVLFCKIYNLEEDDIKMESMYRNYQRHSSKKISLKNLHTKM